MTKHSLLSVPPAGGGSSDKTSSLCHATHSPFGQTHSGMSDAQSKHGQCCDAVGPDSSQRITWKAQFPLPALDANANWVTFLGADGGLGDDGAQAVKSDLTPNLESAFAQRCNCRQLTSLL